MTTLEINQSTWFREKNTPYNTYDLTFNIFNASPAFKYLTETKLSLLVTFTRKAQKKTPENLLSFY